MLKTFLGEEFRFGAREEGKNERNRSLAEQRLARSPSRSADNKRAELGPPEEEEQRGEREGRRRIIFENGGGVGRV